MGADLYVYVFIAGHRYYKHVYSRRWMFERMCFLPFFSIFPFCYCARWFNTDVQYIIIPSYNIGTLQAGIWRFCGLSFATVIDYDVFRNRNNVCDV